MGEPGVAPKLRIDRYLTGLFKYNWIKSDCWAQLAGHYNRNKRQCLNIRAEAAIAAFSTSLRMLVAVFRSRQLIRVLPRLEP